MKMRLVLLFFCTSVISFREKPAKFAKCVIVDSKLKCTIPIKKDTIFECNDRQVLDDGRCVDCLDGQIKRNEICENHTVRICGLNSIKKLVLQPICKILNKYEAYIRLKFESITRVPN